VNNSWNRESKNAPKCAKKSNVSVKQLLKVLSLFTNARPEPSPPLIDGQTKMTLENV